MSGKQLNRTTNSLILILTFGMVWFCDTSAASFSVNVKSIQNVVVSTLEKLFGKNDITVFLQSEFVFQKLLVLIVLIAIITVTIIFYRSRLLPVRFMTTTRISVMDKIVQRACRYVEKHYTSPDLTVHRICEDLVVGTSFLEALFEKDLGMSVNQFINQVRINHLKYLLNQDSETSLEILARSTGFHDTQQCVKVFNEITGINFDEYREGVRSGVSYAKKNNLQ
ncbi:MAG: AraC family transcriptional regulator [Fibrobacter sp.]|nr:AraC family transcriptional regulator [Fibrobacter sp.]